MTKGLSEADADLGDRKEQDSPASLPFLRWAGSKRKLLPTLSAFCPISFGTYIEPFAGSACLFFLLRPRMAILGDFNTELIHAYRKVSSHPKAVFKQLSSFPSTQEFYYSLRAKAPADLSSLERATRFIYLNRFCFNGVYRTNKLGLFNVPRGTKTGTLPTLEQLLGSASALRQAKLIAGDFEETMDRAKLNDFVYLDPPYSANVVRHRGEYGYGGFVSADLMRLKLSLEELDYRGAAFLLSYRWTKAVSDLFSCWNQRAVIVQRHVAGFARNRHKVRELLVSNRELNARGEH